MTEAHITRTFDFGADEWFEDLLDVLPSLDIEIERRDPASRTIRGTWPSATGARFTIQAVCTSVGENATTVTLTYCPEVRPDSPGLPIDAMPEEVAAMMERIFEALGRYLPTSGALSPTTPDAKPEPREGIEGCLNIGMTPWIVGILVTIAVRLCAFATVYQEIRAGDEGWAWVDVVVGGGAAFLGGLIAGGVARYQDRANGSVEGAIVGVMSAVWLGCGRLFGYRLTLLGVFVYILAGTFGGWVGSLTDWPWRPSK